jgi:hypothetical protein
MDTIRIKLTGKAKDLSAPLYLPHIEKDKFAQENVSAC